MVCVGNIISLNITTLHLNDIVYIHIDSCMCTHLHNTHIYNLNICLWLFKSSLAFLSNHPKSLSLCIPPLSFSLSLSHCIPTLYFSHPFLHSTCAPMFQCPHFQRTFYSTLWFFFSFWANLQYKHDTQMISTLYSSSLGSMPSPFIPHHVPHCSIPSHCSSTMREWVIVWFSVHLHRSCLSLCTGSNNQKDIKINMKTIY